ncbi:MAG: hypothetical protein J0J06_00400 [Sphingomonas sp.]|uniref:hypothetical protein n=1 Tax=Sphingomonas sp. TaxID=28214 RepID=UPI001AC4249F|nr:hypothetical protein [Sphingomonas sp.]MBN8813887.1 hypothetical protein [Sphingomonas sp.]
MTNSLLVLIVLILLFGAGVVRGVLLNFVGLIVFALLVVAIFMTVPPIVFAIIGSVAGTIIVALLVRDHRTNARRERAMAIFRKYEDARLAEERRRRLEAQMVEAEKKRMRFHNIAPDKAARRAIKRHFR